MSWQLSLTIMVRELIGDTSDTPTYSDDRIQNAIVVGGIIASQEFGLEGYTFDLEIPDITPDPTDPATLDNVAIALFTLKAACIIVTGAYRQSISTGIRVRDGDSEVDTTGSFKGYSDIIKLGPCASYDALVTTLGWKLNSGQGKAVVSCLNTRCCSNGCYDARTFFDNWCYW